MVGPVGVVRLWGDCLVSRVVGWVDRMVLKCLCLGGLVGFWRCVLFIVVVECLLLLLLYGDLGCLIVLIFIFLFRLFICVVLGWVWCCVCYLVYVLFAVVYLVTCEICCYMLLYIDCRFHYGC